jgi:serine/threonine-protein kinase
VLKSIAHRPEERYATIDAFADDIDRYLHHYPVIARPHGIPYRVAQWVARNAVAAAAAAAVLTAVLGGAALAAWQAHVARRETAHAVEVRDFMLALFHDASPYNSGGRAMSAVDWLKHVRARVDRRLEDRPALRVQLLNILGASLLNLQDTSAAEEVLTQAVQEGTRRLGPNHPASIRARVLMTPVHRYRGRTAEMRRELALLLPMLRAAGGLSEDLAIALKNQAHLDIDDGRYAAAERAAQEAVDVATRALGDRHPEAVAALLTRAYAYQFSRDPAAALTAAEGAYRTALAVFGELPRHPRVIEGRLLYGRALGEAGNAVDGVPQLAQAVADAAETFGPSSRMVGFFSLPLAAFQLEIGQVAASVENSRKAVDIIARHTRPQSFRFGAAVHQRGAALLAARRPAEALPDLARAASTLQAAFSADHAVTRWFQTDEALALARTGDYRRAEQLMAGLVPSPPSRGDRLGGKALYVTGVARRLSGDPGAALRLQQRAVTMLSGDASTALHRMKALTEIGLTLLDLARPEEALTPLEEARSLSRRVQPHLGPDGADIMVGLGRAHLALDRPGAGCQSLRAADRFWRGFDGRAGEAQEAARLLSLCDRQLRARSASSTPARVGGAASR